MNKRALQGVTWTTRTPQKGHIPASPSGEPAGSAPRSGRGGRGCGQRSCGADCPCRARRARARRAASAAVASGTTSGRAAAGAAATRPRLLPAKKNQTTESEKFNFKSTLNNLQQETPMNDHAVGSPLHSRQDQ